MSKLAITKRFALPVGTALCAAVLAGAAAPLFAGTPVFNDEKLSFAWEATADVNGNGDIDQNEFLCVNKANVAVEAFMCPRSEISDSATVYDLPPFEMQEVDFRALGITATVPTWRCEPRMTSAASDSWAAPSVMVRERATWADTEFTFVARIKWDGTTFKTHDWNGNEVTLSCDEDQILMVNGHESPSWRIAIRPNGELYLRDSYNAAYSPLCRTSMIKLAPGEWWDIAVTGEAGAKEDVITLYAVGPGPGYLIRKEFRGVYITETNRDAGYTLYGTRRHWTGFSIDNGKLVSDGDQLASFVGNIQFLALWGRVLSPEEIHEAWTRCATGRWSIGMRNGKTEEFGGDDDTTFAANAGTSWAEFPDEVRPGHSATVAFQLTADEAALPYALQLCGVNAGAAAVAVSVNGAPFGGASVSASAPGLVYIPAGTFTAGDNTVALSVGSDSSSWEPDFLCLAGSFQLGAKDGSGDEFLDDHDAFATRLWAESRDCAGLNDAIANSTADTWTLSTVLPAEIAAAYPFKFTVKTLDGSDGGVSATIKVNGTAVRTGTFAPGEETVVDLPAGTFADGINDISIAASGSGIAADWFQLSLVAQAPAYPAGAVFRFK